jgi:hypothetical protein
MSALVLEAIALLAILGVAQPLTFQRMLHRLGSQGSSEVKPTEVSQPPIHFSHPMDLFQQPVLAPAQLPSPATAPLWTDSPWP